jgi:hypothetical protein
MKSPVFTIHDCDRAIAALRADGAREEGDELRDRRLRAWIQERNWLLRREVQR